MKRGIWENIIYNSTKDALDSKTAAEVYIATCNAIIAKDVTDKLLELQTQKNALLLMAYFKKIGIDNVTLEYNKELDENIQNLSIPENKDENKQKKLLSYMITNKTIKIEDNIDLSNIELVENIDKIYEDFYNVINDKELFISKIFTLYVNYFSEIPFLDNVNDPFILLDKIYDILNDNNTNIINNLSDEIISSILENLNTSKFRVNIDKTHKLYIPNILTMILDWRKDEELPEFNNIQEDIINELKTNKLLLDNFVYSDKVTAEVLLKEIINTINSLNEQENIMFASDDKLKEDIINKIITYFNTPQDNTKLQLFYKFLSKKMSKLS